MDGMSIQQYRYDATGLLVGTRGPGHDSEQFWRGAYPANALRRHGGGEVRMTWLREAGRPLLEEREGDGARRTLLATDVAGSVLIEADAQVRTLGYAPHGHRGEGLTTPAFHGELQDALTGWYLLGGGHHRPYSPALALFLAPDRASPYGAGGINPLTWCAGDPINRSDPSGHFWKWIVAAAGIALGVVAVATSFGAASGAVGAMVAGGIAALTKTGAAAIATTTLGVSALGAETGAIIAGATGNQKAAGILGWVGLGLGLVGAAPAIAKGIGRLGAKFSAFSQRVARIRTVGLSGDGAISAGRQMARRQSMAAPGRRQSMAAPAGRAPTAANTTPAHGRSTFVGYHGTSGSNAESMIREGADSLYVTDRYGSAMHYASRREDGVVLAMYADDVEALRVTQRPAVNGKGIAEAIATNTRLRAVKVTDPASAAPMHDFIDFYMGRQLSGDDILAQLRRMNGDGEMDNLLRRHGVLPPLSE